MTILLGSISIILILVVYYFTILPISMYFAKKLIDGESELKLPHNYRHHTISYILLGILFFLVSLILLFLFIGISYELGKYIQENIMFV